MSESAEKSLATAAATCGLSPGTKVGSYTLGKLLAEGGMGAVYEATHGVTKQRRALKVVRAELAQNADFRDRFVREVTIASSVKHPNLVDTQDPIEADGLLVLPMELLEGETLSARLRRGKLSAAQMVDLLIPLCLAVHAVHERNVIHRDLKPLNIFLAKGHDGRTTPKVLDFGAAREVDDTEHTRTGLVIGSPFYMAPEQAEARKDLDARTDVYSLGVIAYHCLTGRRPHESDSAQSAMVKLIRREKFESPSKLDATVSAELGAAVMKALAYDREERHASTAAFAQALAVSVRPRLGGPTGSGALSESTMLTDIGASGSTIQLDSGDLALLGDSGVRESTPKLAPRDALASTALVGKDAGFAAPPAHAPKVAQKPGSRRGLAIGAVVVVLLCLAGWAFASMHAGPGPTPERAVEVVQHGTEPILDPPEVIVPHETATPLVEPTPTLPVAAGSGTPTPPLPTPTSTSVASERARPHGPTTTRAAHPEGTSRPVPRTSDDDTELPLY